MSFFTGNRRLVVSALSCVALMVALGFSTLGSASESTTTKSTQLAAAERGSDETANRGSARTAETSTTTTALPATTTTVVTTTTAAPTTTTTTAPKPTTTVPAHSQTGGASYYAQPWANKGCAHKTLPKGTVLTVTNIATGKTASCVVNDRGPFVAGRIIDLDTTIFRQLASTSQGVFQARISW